ncbi:MAG: hypothetical protein WBP45_15050 [Daejeonella sp.]
MFDGYTWTDFITIMIIILVLYYGFVFYVFYLPSIMNSKTIALNTIEDQNNDNDDYNANEFITKSKKDLLFSENINKIANDNEGPLELDFDEGYLEEPIEIDESEITNDLEVQKFLAEEEGSELEPEGDEIKITNFDEAVLDEQLINEDPITEAMDFDFEAILNSEEDKIDEVSKIEDEIPLEKKEALEKKQENDKPQGFDFDFDKYVDIN